jgi:hypothetical protein
MDGAQRLGWLNCTIKFFIRVKMRKPSDENIKNTLKLANEMIFLAEKGSLDRFDNGCGVLYGVLLDSAFKIKKIAEAEKEAHIKKGWWE